MTKIKILPEDLMNKIAAGEVVERPASVVKELVENAIDAEATRVGVEVEKGGRKLIRVVDDGSGMNREDATMAFERHATSKISSADDLFKINTLGFRGEALPSIASISQMTLKTKTPKSVAGTMIEVAGGKMNVPKEAGASPGTVIEAKNLFYNTPARRKYLKSINTEYGHIMGAVIDQALAHPEVGFRLKHNKRQTLLVPPKQKFSSRVASIFGEELSQNLVPVKYQSPYLRIRGFVGKPAVARSSREQQWLFVNGRRVENRLIAKAAFEGYHTMLQKQEYPIYFLFLSLNADLVDVNVHPQKKEVRFLNQNMIFTAVRDAVNQALEETELAPRVDLVGRRLRGSVPTELKSAPRTVSPDSQRQFAVPSRSVTSKSAQDFVKELLTEEAGEDDYKILGQVNRTYIVLEENDSLKLIDQHAAHERELFDKFKKQKAKGKRQKLLTPVKIELAGREAGALRENLPAIKELGLEIESFGQAGNVEMFSVTAVPADLVQVDAKEFIKNILDDLLHSPRIKKIRNVREKIVATMACRGAVKAGDDLEYEEMKRLVDLVLADEIKTCPHGRPVMVELSWGELEKQFGRKK
ncbi:DNA mismatch repair endonuclease MutL [Patescibacteria group bacterium]